MNFNINKLTIIFLLLLKLYIIEINKYFNKKKFLFNFNNLLKNNADFNKTNMQKFNYTLI